jgi:CPA1 family monovalent cation:H+ antiporter
LNFILAGFLMIPLVLLSRFISVSSTVRFLRLFRWIEKGTARVLTWAGLRGGISVALALSLPAGPERSSIIAITYIIMAFSILVQGLTVGRVIEHYFD